MRIAAGEADLVLGCDMVVVNDYWVLSKIRTGRSNVVLNSYEAMPGTFTTRPDMQFPATDIMSAISKALGDREQAADRLHVVDATQLATALLGDAIATNLFILGYAWQQALVPIAFDSLMRAVELNGAAVEMNKTAFAWGRLAAIDPTAVAEAAGLIRNAPTAAEATPHELPMLKAGAWEGNEWGANAAPLHDARRKTSCATCRRTATTTSTFLPLDDARLSRSLDELITRRIAFLTDYQDAAYARALQRLRRQGARGREARRRRAAPT